MFLWSNSEYTGAKLCDEMRADKPTDQKNEGVLCRHLFVQPMNRRIGQGYVDSLQVEKYTRSTGFVTHDKENFVQPLA